VNGKESIKSPQNEITDELGTEIENENDKQVDQVLNEILKYQTKLCNDIHFIKKSIEKKETYRESLNKWRFAAKVIDRLGFVISTVYLIITIIWILLSLSSFYQFK
jgi:hypothetical protein